MFFSAEGGEGARENDALWLLPLQLPPPLWCVAWAAEDGVCVPLPRDCPITPGEGAARTGTGRTVLGKGPGAIT